MSVHQCPLCELRFQFDTELEDHLASEHPRRIHPGFPHTPHEPGHLEPVEHPTHASPPRPGRRDT